MPFVAKSEICAPLEFNRGELCDKSEKSENCAWWVCAKFAGFLRIVVLSCRVILLQWSVLVCVLLMCGGVHPGWRA